MRRVAALVLMLVAAVVSPLRQGCGTTCLDPAAGHAQVEVATPQAVTSCHKPAPPPEPVPAQARTAVDLSASQWMAAAPPMYVEIQAREAAGPTARREPPGSPPFLRNTPLRV